MSDLKDLAWSVQEKISPPPFEQLERRGVRRQRRRRALVATVAASVVVLAAVLPWSDRLGTEQPTIAPSVPPLLQGSDPEGEALVRGANADVVQATITTSNNWGALWSDCQSACTYAAVLRRDGVKATTPVRKVAYQTLQFGNEVMAVAGPEGEQLAPDDPTWSQSVLFRLTDRGPDASSLRYAEPSKTFDADEILIDSFVSGGLVILNPEESTVRPLVLPGVDKPLSADRDSTGRWWVLSGELGSRGDIHWTDDGGETWHRTLLDPDNAGNSLDVSPNGRVIAATSMDTNERIATMKLSTDRGATWTTVNTPRLVRAAGPVVSDDGTIMLLGGTEADPTPTLYRLADGQVLPVADAAGRLRDLASNGTMLWGPAIGAATSVRIATTTDRGQSWNSFQPR
jgi:hypothetical protein